jgi:ADP-ribosylglycohydrolase
MTELLDRAAGVLVASAAGDALGVRYEFGARTTDPQMLGGGLGGLPPGQWSDDTDMACAITRAALEHRDLRSPAALDAVAQGFHEWFASRPGDVGIQTRRVLECSEATADSLRNAAFKVHHANGRSAGNGSLMRTAPVVLAHLHDEAALVSAAAAVSTLTHYEEDATEACILWCLAIRHSVLTGELDVRAGLHLVDPVWRERLDEAETHEPSHFSRTNGWVVAALQGAWSAIFRSTSLEAGLRQAVCGGGDTDTVAAIAGALLGAAYGESAVPPHWRAALHGWPGWRADDLASHATAIVSRGVPA